ncbi:tetratricopeptide repeat protein 28-like [Orbicella faveolata]|uniref:tetratricopeptide repeat protein 28-like n=1 Tax=Orbicella faveolata TaxID=48498 RepID=UPI0009E20A07|nr:tetratricopeptide repeat protein 28-like [Orbicella faveolata]
MNLPICYKLIIAPVVSFFEGPEIIIVPDRALYQIPFAALTDESGKYLSETFRIRIAPSLTTLKLINESPADYHCQTGALIVGNPDVGEVHFKGKLTNISRLHFAENEARMVAKKLGVEPLLGRQATKQAVLQAMNSVALIHIGAHGDAERGAIALAPSFRIPNGIPQEGLYLLTMSDISKIQLRAKLVVLSCCHSARGQTKAEGAVGTARAFLGSGARSVLVSLWALDDKATEQLMTHFYDHLVAGESAGESLHEAMKWMRSKGYDVNQWAPFILIGDDVTFDFGEKGVGKNNQDSSE